MQIVYDVLEIHVENLLTTLMNRNEFCGENRL
jgi:hypothetical protein